MAADFPGAVKTFSAVVNGVTKLVMALFNSPYDEITAIETELGTDPAGSASDLKTRLAVSLNDNGTLKPILGAWVDKTASYGSQQAATDGFVLATVANNGTVLGYTDGSNPPTTLRGRNYGINQPSSIMMPVKKNDYWKVAITDAVITSVYWIPLGSV